MVLQATMNRDDMRRKIGEAPRVDRMGPTWRMCPRSVRSSARPRPSSPISSTSPISSPASGSDAGPSQPDGAAHFLLAMPDEAFAAGFGTEWYIRDEVSTGTDAGPMAGLFKPMR